MEKEMGKDILYETMKVIAKQRKIKASKEHDLYKKVDPYFYNVFYCFDSKCEKEAGKTTIILDFSLKYCRFDELRWEIISPNNNLKFTDKIRANSLAACPSSVTRKSITFKYDDSTDGLHQLCKDILDYAEKFYKDFFESIHKSYGTLEEYYLENKADNPLLAGLIYVERKQYKEAEKCFLLPNMNCKNSYTSINPITKEQLTRVNASCKQSYLRSDYEKLLDYTIAMQYGIKWTEETAKYGLLPEERHGK